MLAFLMLVLCAGAAFGQAASFPTKPIRVIMPFPAGGSADAGLRPVTEALRPILGQPVILDARPGAGGVIATRYVIEQPADGYTIAMISNGSAIRSAVPNRPFDIRKDLAHIAQTVETPMGIAVNSAKLPVKSLEELVDFARANPGRINFSSFGQGTMAHLIIEYIAETRSLKLVHVPYNGSPAEFTALLRGDSDAGLNSLRTYYPGLGGGKLRVIAITSAGRSEAAPDIPGMKESGFEGIDIPGWTVLSAPAATASDILNKLNFAINKALAEPAVREQIAKLGSAAQITTREQVTQRINREVAIYERVIRTANIVIE